MAARSESRKGTAVRVLAVHTTEGKGTAEALRDATWWTGSSHALADETGTLLTPAQGCVAYDRAAWTLRSGNPWSENIELVGMAAWTRPVWLTKTKLLEACARWLADRSEARGIPLVKLTPAEYRAGKSGVIGHNDHTVGYSDGTHWDPGPNFPWDVVLAKAVALRDADKPAPSLGGFMTALTDDEQREVLKGIRELTKVRELKRAGVPAGVGTIGEIAAGLDVALNSVLDVTKADVGTNIAVRDHILATRRELRALVVQVDKLVEALGSADKP